MEGRRHSDEPPSHIITNFGNKRGGGTKYPVRGGDLLSLERQEVIGGGTQLKGLYSKNYEMVLLYCFFSYNQIKFIFAKKI